MRAIPLGCESPARAKLLTCKSSPELPSKAENVVNVERSDINQHDMSAQCHVLTAIRGRWQKRDEIPRERVEAMPQLGNQFRVHDESGFEVGRQKIAARESAREMFLMAVVPVLHRVVVVAGELVMLRVRVTMLLPNVSVILVVAAVMIVAVLREGRGGCSE
jgi:hypothetical protein